MSDRSAELLTRLSTLPILVAGVAAVALLASLGDLALQQTTVIMLANLIFVVGLYTFVGNSGVFSFGHMSFAAAGAYTVGIFEIPVEQKRILYSSMPAFLRDAHPLPTIVAILLGAAVAGLFGLVVGLALMRASGLAAALATFAILLIVNVVASNLTPLTNGSSGLSGVPITATVEQTLAWAAVVIAVAFAFQQTSLCRRLRASREDEAAARAIGVRIERVRLAGFVLSASLVGIGGGLYALVFGTIQPNAFYISITFLTLAMLVVGGMTSLSGAVVGTVVLAVLSELLRRAEQGVNLGFVSVPARPGLQEVGFAVVALLILIFRPRGLLGGAEIRLGRRQARGRAGGRSDGVPTDVQLVSRPRCSPEASETRS